MSEPGYADSRFNQLHPVALPSLGWHGAPLPVPGTSFVGREREIQDLGELLELEGVRLVTLTGPGGVGKSRLGLRVARQLAARFEDGVVFVDLAPEPSVSGIATLIAGAMGVRDVAASPTIDRLAEVLHNRELLLFLDGFEVHVAEATLLADLLGRCPRLTILVTSREPLRLSTEWVMPVGPLAVPDDRPGIGAVDADAVNLFLERARAIDPTLPADDPTVAEVAAIVRALDGLPLAIELAAARLTHLTPQALLQRLDRRMTLLTGGALDLPERHQTLRRSIAWSHDLLTPDEQAGFRRLAVFVKGFTLDAAGHVIGVTSNEGVDVVDLIGSLVSRSMIRRVEGCDGEPRFAMLDTLREFAAEHLEAAGESTGTRDRHAAWFVSMAERADESIFGGPDHVLWLDRLQADLENLRAALRWLESRGEVGGLLRLAANLGGLWVFRSFPVEGRQWLRRALELDDGTNPLARAMAGVKLAVLERQLGGGDTFDLAMMALDLRLSHGDKQSIGRAYVNLGVAFRYRHEREKAIQAFQQAESSFDEIQDLDGLGMSMMCLGDVALEDGDLSLAETYTTDSLSFYRQSGFANGEARALLVLGWISAGRNETARAAGLYGNSLGCWLQSRNTEGLIDALAAVAALAINQDRNDLAATLLGTADALCTVIGYVPPQPWQAARKQAVHRCHASLGESGYEAAHGAGGQLSGEAAVALAVEMLVPLSNRERGVEPAAGSLFTPRERDVLRLLVEGRSDREIALELNLKYRTVTSHVRNILDKLDVSSRTAAATRAVREGLV